MVHIAYVDASPVTGLFASSQGPNIGSTAISLTTASESVTASQIRGAPQPQGPSSTAAHIPPTAIDTNINASISLSAFRYMGSHLAPASAKPTKHLMDADASQSHASRPPAHLYPAVVPINLLPAVAKPAKQLGDPDPSPTHASREGSDLVPAFPEPAKHPEDPVASQSHDGDVLGKSPLLKDNTSASSTKISVGIDGEISTQDSRSQTVQLLSKAAKSSDTTRLPQIQAEKVIPAMSTQIPSLERNTVLPTFGAQTITGNSESQNYFTSDLTLFKGSTPTLGSGTSTTVLAPQNSVTRPFMASDSILSHATTMPTLSEKPPFLTISGQMVTADSLGQHSTDIQALTKSGVSTLSGTTISLAPNESALLVGTSAATFDPSATATFGSGSNGTEVQRFNGNALGAREGLGSSSMMLLVSFVLLLWL